MDHCTIVTLRKLCNRPFARSVLRSFPLGSSSPSSTYLPLVRGSRCYNLSLLLETTPTPLLLPLPLCTGRCWTLFRECQPACQSPRAIDWDRKIYYPCKRSLFPIPRVSRDRTGALSRAAFARAAFLSCIVCLFPLLILYLELPPFHRIGLTWMTRCLYNIVMIM